MNVKTASSTAIQPTALVLGLGASGLAMARWLDRLGWRVRVADTRLAPPQLAQLRDEHVYLGSDPIDAVLIFKARE